jgi:hypothetical protein
MRTPDHPSDLLLLERTGIPEPLLQADTAVRAAANTMTFGGADHAEAGIDALFERGGLEGWEDRYRRDLIREQARNSYDAMHRPTAQKAGQVGGTVLSFVSLPTRAAALPRLVGAAKLSGRELLGLAGLGGAGGLVGQTATDMVSGRSSSVGDTAAAVLGGMAGGVTLPFAPQQAGAANGWVTSAAGDLLNGRPISLDRAGQSAVAGRLFGAGGSRAGVRASDSLPPVTKGMLGEVMGEIRSAANGQKRNWVKKARDYLSQGYWVPDARRGIQRFEDKFGYKARLSLNQLRAQAELGKNFILYHFTPDDVGRLLSLPTSSLGAQATNGDRRRAH